MTKQCAACLLPLAVNNFHRDYNTYDGFKIKCKVCTKNKKPTLIKRKRGVAPSTVPFMKRRSLSCKKYEKTYKGFLMRTYRNMKSRVLGIQKRSAHIYIGLTLLPKNLFYSWALNNAEYAILFKDWVDSKYISRLTPSIDRIDATKGYEEGNIRWVTLSQNSRETQQWRSLQGTSTTT